jgi:hypothetical protein
MNQVVRGILIIYITSTLFYLVYTKYTDSKINNLINNLDDEKQNEYTKLMRYRMLVFILGILVSLGILIFIEPEYIKKTVSNINNISDVSDINVIS